MSRAGCLLALDQGTTSSRALVFDSAGAILALAQREFPQHYPRPGLVEHDPRDIWRTQLAVAHEALAAAGLGAAEVAGIGISNQRETTLLWDRRTGEPLGPAIVWQDRRTAAACEALRAAGAEPLLQARAGLLLDPYFSASKIAWLLAHVDGARRRAQAGELAAGTVDSWLLWHLTGGREHITDATNASRTALLNIDTGQWDEDLLALWDIPAALLPRVVDSSGVCAHTDLLGGGRIAIAGVAGDQQAALFGQACFDPGMAKCTYGTGCFVLMHTGTAAPRSSHRLLTTIAVSIGGQREYALEGSVFMGGAIIQWLRDALGLIESAAAVEALAASVPDSGGVVLVPAFAGLGAPHWDPDARAALFGMTRGTGAAHIARAALEAIAMQVTEVCEVMDRDAGAPLSELRVDGGAAVNDLLMQTQADLLGRPLLRPRHAETTAWGAAALAGLATGIWPDRATLASAWQCEARFTPGAARPAIEALRRHWPQAIARTRAWQD